MKLFFRYLQELGILVFSMALDLQGHNQRWYSLSLAHGCFPLQFYSFCQLIFSNASNTAFYLILFCEAKCFS